MTSVMPGLRPATSGVALTARPAGTVRISNSSTSLRASADAALPSINKSTSPFGSDVSASKMTANPKLSVIEIEALLREKVKHKCHDLQQAFQTFDVDQCLSITKGEFRKVLETFCFPLTTEQFNDVINKVDLNPNGTVRYCDFIDKFYKGSGRQSVNHWITGTHRYIETQSPKEMNTDMLEKMLKDKIQKNFKNVLKALRLYDYNHDGHIQRHELRKVLENYCFKFSDQQFDKLYQRYDFHHTGLLDYRDFLYRLGVAVADRQKADPVNGTKGVMNWAQIEQKRQEAQQNRQERLDKNDLAGMGIHEIEVEFRKQMRENYANLKRVFMALDRNLDGFVDIEDLKSVLCKFTIPLSDQLFAQLMDRFQIKASGKVSWEVFLEKFQDPQSWGNGQTIPIKPNHKYFPIRGVNEKMSLKDVIRLLDQHVKTAYNSYKEAFLQMDKTRQGNIPRKELRKLLQSFKFNLTDDQFRELMILLDPQHTNFISYHRFLDLFEERETKEGHKWLKSVHRVNENLKPAILAWETVEDILQEKITENWKEIASTIVSHDDKGEGMIKAKQLRKIIQAYCLPVSDEHFNHMTERLEDKSGDKINYTEFMVKLGVDVSPGDLEGLSTQIHEKSDQAEADRLHELISKQALQEQRVQERGEGMSPEEVISRLKDRMSQHNNKIRGAFHSYDKTGKGRIGKKAFRKVIEDFGIHMTDEQFKDLCAQLSFHNGHMTYADFVNNFDDPRPTGVSEDLVKAPNHRWNEVRGQEFGMTAVEAEGKLRSKLRENFADLRGAFYKFDDDHSGKLTKKNFRRLLDAFNFVLSDEEYEKLCEKLEINKKSKISYRDFLEKFEMVDDMVEGHKWLNSVHRWNETLPVKPMTAEEVHKVLVEKAHRQYQDLAKAFCTIDRKGKNVITKRELRDTLYKFILPISKEEFTRLWAMYDSESKGYVTHDDFLKRLTGEQFAPGDHGGTSHHILDNSNKKMEEHLESQQAKHEQITFNQAVLTTDWSVDQLLRQLKDKIRDTYKDFYTAFKKYDSRKRGYLTTTEIQKVLVEFNYFLDDDQFFDLLDRMGLTNRRSRLHYDDFLKVFEEGRKDSYKPKKSQQVRLVSHDRLSPEEAVTKLMDMVEAQTDVLQNAFGAFDKTDSGRISPSDFRRILDHFCFKLTNSQFKHLMSKLTIRGDNRVDYHIFLDSFRGGSNEDTSQWLESIKQRLETRTPQLLSMEEVHEYLLELVTARFYHIARAFAEIDYAKIGVICKEDFKEILYKYTMRLSDRQFEKLWSTLGVNDFDNIDYKDFLRKYTLESGVQSMVRAPYATNTPRPMQATLASYGGRPQSAQSDVARQIRHYELPNGRLSRAYTPLVNAEGVERLLEEKVRKHWQVIQKQCRAFDTEDTGDISFSDFEYILGRSKISLNPDDMDKLLTKYELRTPGRFCYAEFLKHFVLGMGDKEDSLMARKKLHRARVPVSTGERTHSYEDAMLRLRRCVLSSWKEMRREFRSIDRTGLGVITPMKFREVLRDFKVDLTEEEFFHLMSYYDKNMTGQVSYNDFIAAFLKSA